MNADTTEQELILGPLPVARCTWFRWPRLGYLFVAHPRHQRNQRLIMFEPHCNLAVTAERTAVE